jgi:hypothetical protein
MVVQRGRKSRAHLELSALIPQRSDREDTANGDNAPFPARVLEAFREMQTLKCTCPPPPRDGRCPDCERWWQLHEVIFALPQCRPWSFPCIARDEYDGDDAARALYQQLAAAVTPH